MKNMLSFLLVLLMMFFAVSCTHEVPPSESSDTSDESVSEDISEPFVPGEAYSTVLDHLTVAFDFADPLGKNVEGTVSVSTDDGDLLGNYSLFYADEAGILEGYATIGSGKLESKGESVNFATFLPLHTAPIGAKSVVLTKKGEKEILAYAEIPIERRTDHGEKIGCFAAVSDIHIFLNEAYNNEQNSINGDRDMQKAITRINAAGVDFTTCSGDMILSFLETDEAIKAELTKSTGIVQKLEKPFYPVKGNHDKEVPDDLWKSLTGCETEYSFTYGDTVFLFLSIRPMKNTDSNDSTPYGSDKLDWLEARMKEAAGKRTVLVMHYPLYGTAGLLPGDRYGFSAGSKEETRIREMIAEHGNVIVFNGHTHFDFQSTATYPHINLYRFENVNSYTVHLPSVAYPRNYANNTITSESQGYIVELYRDGMLLKGMDFVTGNYMPAAIWYLDTRKTDNALETTAFELSIGESADMKLSSVPTSVGYRSYDSSVATVDENGRITAMAEGVTTLVAEADGFVYKASVKVIDPANRMQGTGSKEEPYLIATARQFTDLQKELREGKDFKGVYFAITADLNLNDSEEYAPSATSTGGEFAGFIDGRGHTVTVKMAKSKEEFAVPIFWQFGGTVINTVFEIDMGGCNSTSYMLGRTMDKGKLANCIVRGKMKANNSSTSVVAGTSSGCVLQNLFIDVKVSGTKPSSSSSGVSVKGSGKVSNVYYTANGCVAQFKETEVESGAGLADALNATLADTATAIGVDVSLLCEWQNLNDGTLALVTK